MEEIRYSENPLVQRAFQAVLAYMTAGEGAKECEAQEVLAAFAALVRSEGVAAGKRVRDEVFVWLAEHRLEFYYASGAYRKGGGFSMN
jgi:hypothetical protein